MSGQQYPPPIPPPGSFYPSGYPPMMPAEALQPRLHQLQTLSVESLRSSTYPEYREPSRAMLPPQPPSRPRRRHHQNSEHVKHRRTRSGCYTCRQRRVKCDESHPICDRCRKGKRECTYPGSASSSAVSQSRSGGRSNDSPPGSSPSESDLDEKIPRSATIAEDEDEAIEDEPQSAVSSRHPSDPSPAVPEAVASPSIRSFARPQPVRSASRQSLKSDVSQNSRWASLPQDVKYYLQYYLDNMSHHHYGFKYDGGDFLRTTYLEIAMNDGSAALLYAIIAFAAYHHTIARNDDNISVFLSHYNKSIAFLQQSLKKKRHNVVTLLTILQLATIEEFLGDWINLMGHQKAAYQILTDLFTSDSVMQDETRRHIINWYFRFDLMASMMAGESTILDRSWFVAAADFYKKRTLERPNDLGARFEEYFATSRRLAMDVTLLFSAKARNSIDDAEFANQVQRLMTEFSDFGRTIETAFTDPSCFVKSFPRAPPPSENDVLDFRDPNFLYGGELSTMNFVLLDHWAIDLTFRHQLTLATGQSPPPELTNIALKKCKMFEAIQYGDEDGPAAALGAQNSLGILALFLPKDHKHMMWCRRKFADIERLGYIYPAVYRTQMSSMWNTDVTSWWLPTEEGCPTTLRMLQEFVRYRAPRTTDTWATGVRDMSGIFGTLNIEEQGASDGPRSAGTESSASPWRHEHSPAQPWT